MNICIAFIISAFVSTSYAQSMNSTTTTTETHSTNEIKPAVMMKNKKTVKTVKSSGMMSASSCKTVDGKRLREGDTGYDDCLRRSGIRK